MSYQVLARKWRPRIFREMVGQEHVLQALINALDHNRLHHAYLFTGTRGVGKTTIARILAKCLNCERGVSSEPCGECSSCVEIAEGRFVDLIEVDAASRTKVEDTRELLENVQYAPTRGRYKVYLIDEVHMLSNSSFNALLKTLEEPPPHVKFLLATTDPQKLPMTILSRCLQFNLKNMNPERIVGHLQFVLEQEQIPCELPALWHLGRAADGSMRDALSLTDQAIAFGSGAVNERDVAAMLGSIDRTAVYDIIEALAALDGVALLAAVAQMAEQSPDYAAALAELLNLLHRIAIAQAVPSAIDNSFGDRERVADLARRLPSEDIQLFYQTALLGRRDLPLAPDPRAGFEMVLLRMLAFKPQGVMDVPKRALPTPNSGGAAPQPAPPQASSSQPSSSQSAPSQMSSLQASSLPSAPSQAAPLEAPAAQASAVLAQTQSMPQSQFAHEASATQVQTHTHSEQQAPVAVTATVTAALAEPQVASDAPPFNPPFDNAPVPRAAQVADLAPSDAPPAEYADYQYLAEASEAGLSFDEVETPTSRTGLSNHAQGAKASSTQPLVEAAVEANTATQVTAARNVNTASHVNTPADGPSLGAQAALAAANSPPAPAAPVHSKAALHALAVQDTQVPKIPLGEAATHNWLEIYTGLGVSGILQATVANLQLASRSASHFDFVLDKHNTTLYSESHQQRLADDLTRYFGAPVTVAIRIGEVVGETPAAVAIRLRAERQAQAERDIHQDPVVQALLAQFDAVIREDSIVPLN